VGQEKSLGEEKPLQIQREGESWTQCYVLQGKLKRKGETTTNSRKRNVKHPRYKKVVIVKMGAVGGDKN